MAYHSIPGSGFHYLNSPFGDTTFIKVFVGGLAWETQSETLRRHFEQYGDILEAVVITDKNTGRSKGYGFVTFRDPEAARRACVNPTPIIDGRRANCNLASLGRPRLPMQYAVIPNFPGLGAIARRMLKLRGRGCCFLCCLIVFVFAVPCYSHETLFDVKTLNAGKELWKETLPLQSGSRVYKLEGLKSNSWYEVKISYPASIPALFTLQLLKNGVVGLKLNQMRRLLNTEKLIFKTESLEEVNNKDGLYVLVTVEPEGIVAIPNIKERSFIIYNIVCEEQLLDIPYSSWSVVVLVVLCLVAALILPRFLPSYLLIKDGDRDR